MSDLDRLARLRAAYCRVNGQQEVKYALLGQQYTRQHLLSFLENSMKSGELANCCIAALGRVKRRLEEYGDDPRRYLQTIENAIIEGKSSKANPKKGTGKGRSLGLH